MKGETTGTPGMFSNLGKTLARIRELRGKSQTAVARLAGIGKSQLSKYESGKELPKLDSLEKVLLVLNVGHFELFRMLALLDRGEELRIPSAEEMDDLFARINRNLFTLHREVVKERYAYNRQGSTEAGGKTFE
ncbi:MAG TPA: helix-turn-helix transcriptional regulator [Thermoanaerobaculia bacterium]|nr:helix-turn-helix transcriptional regulator [Thermoanaerobaculia bacterium]